MVHPDAIVGEYESRQDFLDAVRANQTLLIIKFRAEWCRPCRKIKDKVGEYFAKMPDNVTCADVDVDESFDLYAYLKSKKMVKGLPVILCYKGENDSFAPDDAVEGTDEKELSEFFERCNKYIN
jgi:thiol-disulfide isomerase/thioredoxin